MPFDRDRYPDDWEQISASIRERAGNKCEWCGVPNGALISRHLDGIGYLIMNDDGEVRTHDGRTVHVSEDTTRYYRNPTKIVLTVAHLGKLKPDGTPGDKYDTMDCRPDNLAALCQKCHLNFDLADHIASSKRKRLERKAEKVRSAGQLSLLDL